MNTIAFYFVFLVALIFGLISFLAPRKVVAFRKSRNWPEDFLSGGMFFSTETRTRWTGFVLLSVAILVMVGHSLT
jgi:dolichyl-phosphate-mannose--protein O-mannosyl transferase